MECKIERYNLYGINLWRYIWTPVIWLQVTRAGTNGANFRV